MITILLEFGPRLNAQSWADAITEHRDYFRDAKYAADEFAGYHVVVDMSKVEFADFVALGHLLIFLRAMTTAGANYWVEFPNVEALASEKAAPSGDRDIGVYRRRRINCDMYLVQAGFKTALEPLTGRLKPSSAGEVRADVDLRGADTPDERLKLPARRRRMLPYRWVDFAHAQAITRSPTAARYASEFRDLGLPAEHAAAFGKGIIAELLENAAEHSGDTVFLLGGVIIPPETYGERGNDLHESLRAVVTRAGSLSSQLVRIVVADAGHGMVSRLEEARTSSTAKVRLEYDGISARRTILEALDHHSASDGTDQHARGLWKVARLAREYGGGLLISTGGHTVARVFIPSSEAQDSHDAAPALLPGTLVECDLLEIPDKESSSSVEEVVTPAGPVEGSGWKVGCVAVSLGRSGFGEEDLAIIRAGIEQGEGRLVVAANVPDRDDGPDDTDIGTAIRQVLNIAADHPNLVTVAMAFPMVNRPMMAIAVEYLNDQCDPPPQAMAKPILVLGPDNRHFWVGGSAAARRALRALSATTGSLTMEQLGRTEEHGIRQARQAVQELQRHTAFVHVEHDTVGLRARPPDVTTAIADHVDAKISRAVNGTPIAGVMHGKFLTPNLQQTSRWCNLDAVLAGLGLGGLTGIALAARVADRIAIDAANPPIVLQAGKAPPDMLAAFARSLIGDATYYQSLDDVRLERVERSASRSSRVIVVTDVMSSHRTLKRALKEILGRDMEPVGVAVAVYDAQTEGPAVEIPFGGRRVPLVNLSVVDLRVEPNSPGVVQAIDPILRLPTTDRHRIPDPLVNQASYIAALQRSNAARLGHIERPANRHYTASVDATRLFRDSDWSAEVTGRIIETVQATHRETFSEDAPVCILYPEGTLDDLPIVARTISAALRDAGTSVTKIIPVPRAAEKERWYYPSSVDIPDDARHAVILDSAAGSARTISHLRRIAATGRIGAISGFLLLNGLTDEDALTLHQMRAVAGPDPETLIPVAMHYVARTAMTGLDKDACGICQLRRTYRLLEMLVPVPKPLASHRDWLLRTLEPRSKRAAFQEQATDLLGAHVGPEDCTHYLTWRFQLREAGLDTKARRRVKRKLDGAARNPDVRDALIRLLVAEPHWLTSAPLWFPDCQQVVANLALSVLTGEAAAYADAMLRVQAIILLAHVAPDRFATKLHDILIENQHERSVLQQALLDATRLLVTPRDTRAYGQEEVVQPMVHDLDRLERNLDGEHRYLVQYVLSHGWRVLQPDAGDRQSAWFALRDRLRDVADHAYDNAMTRVFTAVYLAGEGEPPTDVDGANEDWGTCRKFLDEEVLPNAYRLRDALLARNTVRHLLKPDLDRFRKTLNEPPGLLLGQITINLETLYGASDAMPEFAAGVHEELLWWYDFFLNSRPGMHALVDPCPTNLVPAVRLEFPTEIVAEPDEAQVSVFCTRFLLKEALTHIRNNIKRHVEDAAKPQRIEVVVETDGEHAFVSVHNDNSKPSSGHLGGLTHLNNELGAFGGGIDHPPPTGDWTFTTRISLERWRHPA